MHGNFYGTSFKAVEDACHGNHVPILDIDVQGARSVHARDELRENALFIFIKPPHIDDLKRRLLTRSTETPESIEERVRNAAAEIEASKEAFWDIVLTNDNLEQCFAELVTFLEEKISAFL